jgi:hypothetical protein
MREAQKAREEMHDHPEDGFGLGAGHSPEEQEKMEVRSKEMRELSEVRACLCARPYVPTCVRYSRIVCVCVR